MSPDNQVLKITLFDFFTPPHTPHTIRSGAEGGNTVTNMEQLPRGIKLIYLMVRIIHYSHGTVLN